MIALFLLQRCTCFSSQPAWVGGCSQWYFIMAAKLFIAFVALALFQQALQCHYSCSSCAGNTYSECTGCGSQQALLKPEGFSSSQAGVCSNISISNTNILGFFLLLFIAATCIAFPSEEVVHIAVLAQSIGLLYLVEILWSKETHFLLSAFTYLMPFLKIQFAYSSQATSVDSFKQRIFFKTPDVLANLSLVGPIDLLLVLLMVVVPLFKALRKRINKERVNCLPDAALDKLMSVVNFVFLMMIQETMLAIYLGLKGGSQGFGGIALSVLYFLSLLFFIINQWFYPFPFFRSKFAQLNIVSFKAILPVFIVSARDTHYIVFVLLTILLTVDLLITNKNRNNSAFNRLLLYKLFSLLAVIVLAGYYCLENILNSQSTSRVLGVICTLMLCGLIYILLMEVCIESKEKYCSKKAQTNQAFEATVEEFRVDKAAFSYDLNEMPLGKPEEVNNNSLLLFPTKNLASSQLSAIERDQSQQMQNSSVKFTEKSSTNRFGRNSVEEKGKEKAGSFQEIQIKLGEQQGSKEIAEAIVPIRTKVSDGGTGKRRAKKRRQREQSRQPDRLIGGQ